jgi:Fe/S biogenesis protein NfuA
LDSPEAQKISQLIEEQINPALAAHSGYVVLHSVENNQVFLEMGGGCQGCAMSYQTMKEGIEGAIKEVVPSIQQVIDVTNHAMGDNPFYT